MSAAIGEQLRQDILSGRYASGAQLRQDALAAQFGVSRIPVREALFALEAEGLVQIAPHKGAVVTMLSGEEIADVFELRALLEPRLLQRSIPLLTPDDFSEMDAVQSRFADAIKRQDRSEWGVLNAQLHLAMYRRAPLPRTIAIVTNLLQTGERYTRLQLKTKMAWRRAETEHAELIALCKARKAKPACALLVRHIEAVRADLETLMQSAPGQEP